MSQSTRTAATPFAGTIVIVPGLRGHVPEHWQSHLARWLPNTVTVPPLDTDGLNRVARVAALEAVVAGTDGPLLFVAHSAGVITLAHWASEHAEGRNIAGAVLATPADVETQLPDGYPTLYSLSANGWLPIPRRPLPFPSRVCMSGDDPLGKVDRIASLAADWNAELVDIGHVGHLNPAVGYGPWPAVLDHIAHFVAMQGSDV